MASSRILVVHQVFALTRRQQCGLVQHVREVGAGESRCSPSHGAKVNTLSQRLAAWSAP